MWNMDRRCRGRFLVPTVLVQSSELRKLFRILYLFAAEVDVLQLIQLANVRGYVLDPDCPGTNAPLEHQKKQGLRRAILQPKLRSNDVSDGLRDLGACLVDEMLVPGVEGRRLASDFFHHPIVRSD